MYKIIGADGREYGPISAAGLRQWLNEGRAHGQTLTQAEGMTGWKPLASFPEFADLAAPPPVLEAPPALSATGPQPLKNSPMAVAGFICSLLGLACCGAVPFSVLGLIFSIVGLSEIKRNPRQFTGGGLAVAGIILAALGLLLLALVLLGGLRHGPFPGLPYHRRFIL
jgi:hypothetical protein